MFQHEEFRPVGPYPICYTIKLIKVS